VSGHSKWSTIKRQKGVADVKRGAEFSKLSRVITLAAKEGKSLDPDLNFKLRFAIDKAHSANMPHDNIQRAIKAGGEAGEGVNLEELTLEGYGPSGVAVMLLVLTDNRNRTVPEIRRIFSEHQGSLGEKGCTAYVFSPEPQNPIFSVSINDEKVAKQVLTLVEKLEEHDDVSEIWSNFEIPDDMMQKISDSSSQT